MIWIFRKIRGAYRRVMAFYERCHYKDYILVKNPNERFECLYHVSDASWNPLYTPEIYDIAKENQMIVKFPAIDIFRIPGAIVNLCSDIVIDGDYAWWDKYNEEDFLTLALPDDKNLLSFNNRTVRVITALKKEFIKGRVLDLTGVYCWVWSHFLFQFVCKMFFAGEAGLLDEDITILVNDYKDENIDKIFESYLSKYPKAHKKVIQPKVDYQCEELINIRSTSFNFNEATTFWRHHYLIPQIVIDRLHKIISEPLVEKIKNNPAKHKKIFLARHSNRILTNTEEVEAFFKEQGFYFIEGWELKLEEKVDLFYHAEIIVGIHSSAWFNLIFCNREVKCLQFVNNRFMCDPQAYTIGKQHISHMISVDGQDETDNRRSNYYIPLDKIKAAYKQLLEY
jgi:hypothetical protein